MKKIILSLFFLVSFCIPCFAANWYWLSPTNDGGQVYIDNESVIKNNQTACVWLKLVHPSGVYEIARMVLSRDGYYMFKERYIYDRNGVLVYSHEYPVNVSTIVPGTGANVVHKAIWGN